jgi:hypothetical protein
VENVAVTVEQAQVVIGKERLEVVLTPSSPAQIVITDPGPQGAVGPGVPAGGQVGQLLEKIGANNYETGWTFRPRVETLQFDIAALINSVATGELAWSADEGTLELGKNGVTNYLGQETMLLCRNNSNTVTIPKGTAVMFAGSVGASGRIKVAPMVANGTLPGYVFFGVTDQVILGAQDGYVSVFGKIRGVNTSAYVDGDILWCDPVVPGGFTKIEPQAPNLKLAVAAVIRAGNNGTIFVRWTTGARLQDLHDVEANGSKANGDVLSWNSINQRWEAKPGGSASSIIAESSQTISQNYTLSNGKNGLSVSPVAIASGYTVTIPVDAVWLIAN